MLKIRFLQRDFFEKKLFYSEQKNSSTYLYDYMAFIQKAFPITEKKFRVFISFVFSQISVSPLLQCVEPPR